MNEKTQCEWGMVSSWSDEVLGDEIKSGRR